MKQFTNFRRIATAALAVAACLALSGCTPGLLGGPVVRTGPDELPAPTPPEVPVPAEGARLVGAWRDADSARITFSRDGTVGGYDGCNDFTGTWRLAGDDDEVVFDLTETERDCYVGPTLFLTDRMTWERTGDRLVLQTTGGGDVDFRNRLVIAAVPGDER